MILAYSGDPFLVARAARRALAARGLLGAVQELGEGMDADTVRHLAAQSGLFGETALLLDLSVFSGQAGVKPRNEVVRALEEVPPETVVVVLDPEATAARQKTYKALGTHEHLPTPRFDALTHWVRRELEAAGVRFEREVPQTLADLMGEDLPGIVSEIEKLAVLDEELTSARVRAVVGRAASRDAFDLIEATTRGDARSALAICQSLLAQGEAPPRILGALAWQYNLVARAVALAQDRAKVDAGLVAQTLKVRPFVAQKALAIARKLDEARLYAVLSALLEADVRMKTGKDERWALEALALRLSRLFADAKPR